MDEMKLQNETQNESKADKFRRIASPRVNKALDAIEKIGNCSSSSYEYTEEQVEAIFGAIEEAVRETKAKFQPRTKKEREKFSL